MIGAQPPSSTRVYVPTTVAGLRHLMAGSLPVDQAFAVTGRLRALLAVPAGDPGVEDELTEAAVVAAADACLALLAEDPAAPRLRIVVAADAVTTAAGHGAHPAAVICPAGITLATVASLLADDPDDLETRAAVRAVMTAQRNGSESDVEDALDTLDDHGLAWFDIGELPDLIERVGRG